MINKDNLKEAMFKIVEAATILSESLKEAVHKDELGSHNKGRSN